MQWDRLALAVAATAAAGLLAEGALHALVERSPRSGGVLFGRELPPYPILAWKLVLTAEQQRARYEEPYGDLVVDGVHPTKGDVWGIKRDDPRLGWAPLESARSAHGWWQTNALGARRRAEVRFAVPPGRQRLLVFGDSFAKSARVRQEEMWTRQLEAIAPPLEAVNFGVGGYGMAQAYLRYRELALRLDFDRVLLLFAPTWDLWRDVNVVRFLFGWDSFTVNPRFELVDGELRLVPSPYPDHASMLAANRDGIEDRLRDHLRRHDRFYFDDVHDPGWLTRHSIIARLVLQRRHARRRVALRAGLMQPEGEALRVSRAIFESFGREVRGAGRTFLLGVLPAPPDVERYREDEAFRGEWNRMVAFLEAGEVPLVDLMPRFLAAELRRLDRSYDGSHWGPDANRLLAEVLRPDLSR